ncbi:alpha/beta hydrolase [Pelagicoccus mobilis]|uniref:Alpha/beta hydrolase n=1 Tax=Pelagicoccus mobilis TaxID=415221 RepID=A0A934RV97_9BACT|nr:alpha/beta hydrolase [Pelagicoccus mobilis]MBK1876075.1 alpha/beta hydrolase [Pelagicoccus mobilis]
MSIGRIWGVVLLGFLALGAKAETEVRAFRDIVFAEVDGQELKLDIFVPQGVESPPLVMNIHGGGWSGGNYKDSSFQWLTAHGFAVASISYRLTDVASHPAQIHDCKGALRWLRANAGKYGYDTSYVVVGGRSAGGHLAALLGTTHGVDALEGTVGGNLDQSSKVDGIIDFYGATDFIQRSKTQPEKTDKPSGIVYRLLGGPVKGNKRIAKQAGAAYHVSKDDPPMLVIHGDEDPQVLIGQSERIVDVYERKGLEVEFLVVEGGGHGGEGFQSPEVRNAIREFLGVE